MRHTMRVASLCTLVVLAAAVPAWAGAPAAVQAKVEPLTLPWWTSTPNYRADAKGGKPFSPAKDTQKLEGDRTFQTVVLETERMRVQVIPELGGVVYRAVDKTARGGKGSDLFYCEQRAKDWLPWWESGVKLSFPYYEHGLSTDNQPASYTMIDNADGSVTLAQFLDFQRFTEPYNRKRYGRFSTMFATQLVTLRPGDACFSMTFRLHNPSPFKQGRRMWVDTLFPRTDTADGPLMGGTAAPEKTVAELIYPTTWASDHGGAALREFAGKTKLSDYVGGSYSLFAWEPAGFAGLYYPNTKTARLRIADPAAAPGAKLWFVGDAKDGAAAKTGQMFNYVELWGGTDHVFEGIENWIGPGETYAFTYTYGMVENAGEVVYANDKLVVTREPGDATKLRVQALRSAVQLQASVEGKSVGRLDFGDDSGLAALVVPAADGKAWTLELNGKCVYQGPIPPAPAAKDDARHARIVESMKGKYNAEMRGYADEQGQTYQTAIGKYADGTTDKGRVLYRDGQIDKAIECLEKAIAANADDGEAHYLLGVAKLEKSGMREAKAPFEAAVAAKQPSPEARYFLAVDDLSRDAVEKMHSRIQQLLRERPSHWEARLLAAWLEGVRLKKSPETALKMATEDAADPRVQWILAEAKSPGAAEALAALLKEPGAQKRVDDFVAATQGKFVPPVRMK